MDSFVAGVFAAGVACLLALALWDISSTRTQKDIRKQCEQQGSMRLDTGTTGEALFYCYREPKK
jgi:hypothetical protein